MAVFGKKKIALDLGTCTTRIYQAGRGIVLCEPTLAAVRSEDEKTISVGLQAQAMLGRTPEGLRAVWPMREGAVAQMRVCAGLLKRFLSPVLQEGVARRADAVICVPSGVTELERQALEDAARLAGIKEISLLEKPLAAAIGAGLDVQGCRGCMVVDGGGGTVDAAVISCGGIVFCRSIRQGGRSMDEAVSRMLREKKGVAVSDCTAERLKICLGSALPDREQTMEVRGRSLTTGLPVSCTVESSEVEEALRQPVTAILSLVREVLTQTPPEVAGDLLESGILLTGGLAQLDGLTQAVAASTGLDVWAAEDAPLCAVMGAGHVLEKIHGVFVREEFQKTIRALPQREMRI